MTQNRLKLRHVLSAVLHLSTGNDGTQGVRAPQLYNYLSRFGSLTDCKDSIKTAMKEGLINQKNRMFFPSIPALPSTNVDLKRTKKGSKQRPGSKLGKKSTLLAPSHSMKCLLKRLNERRGCEGVLQPRRLQRRRSSMTLQRKQINSPYIHVIITDTTSLARSRIRTKAKNINASRRSRTTPRTPQRSRPVVLARKRQTKRQGQGTMEGNVPTSTIPNNTTTTRGLSFGGKSPMKTTSQSLFSETKNGVGNINYVPNNTNSFSFGSPSFGVNPYWETKIGVGNTNVSFDTTKGFPLGPIEATPQSLKFSETKNGVDNFNHVPNNTSSFSFPSFGVNPSSDTKSGVGNTNVSFDTTRWFPLRPIETTTPQSLFSETKNVVGNINHVPNNTNSFSFPSFGVNPFSETKRGVDNINYVPNNTSSFPLGGFVANPSSEMKSGIGNNNVNNNTARSFSFDLMAPVETTLQSLLSKTKSGVGNNNEPNNAEKPMETTLQSVLSKMKNEPGNNNEPNNAEKPMETTLQSVLSKMKNEPGNNNEPNNSKTPMETKLHHKKQPSPK